MKRVFSLCLTLVMILGMLVTGVAANEQIKVVLDGNVLEFDVLPQLIDDRTMVPMRKIFEAMGATVKWEESTQTVTADKDGIVVVMQIDNKEITVNDEKITLDVPPLLIDSRTLVPVRAVAESFDAKVEWDEAALSVIITTGAEGDDVYSYPNPVIDFSEDDGVMSKLHCGVRYVFEQTILPQTIFENSELLKDSIVNNPEEFIAFIDNDIWTFCMSEAIMEYITETEGKEILSLNEEIIKKVTDLADKYSLHAYQNYEVDAIMLDENVYCILLSMAEMENAELLSEMDKMLLSTYVAIVYDSTTEKFCYYTLEKSIGDYYMFCSINEDMERSNYGVAEKNKKVFIEKITELISE